MAIAHSRALSLAGAAPVLTIDTPAPIDWSRYLLVLRFVCSMPPVALAAGVCGRRAGSTR